MSTVLLQMGDQLFVGYSIWEVVLCFPVTDSVERFLIGQNYFITLGFLGRNLSCLIE